MLKLSNGSCMLKRWAQTQHWIIHAPAWAQAQLQRKRLAAASSEAEPEPKPEHA